jgi:hypothetical protein
MKNLLLALVAIGSFSLFSFRTVSDIKITKNAENLNLYDVETTTATFTQYYREFSDKFVATRETWTKVSAIFSTGQLTVSENEMEELLENL